MSNDTIFACLIVDDVPLNATYWARKQQTAFGYKPKETGAWGENWRAQEAAQFFPLRLAHEFADFVEEFDIRGKFTFLPCPGGLGRIDRSVRGYTEGELRELVTLVRERLMPRFDITPEVLTHSMAFDPATEGLLPHVETAWLTHLSAAGKKEELCSYLRFGWNVMENVGIRARGITLGGMPDLSNIGKGESLLSGHHREGLAEALMYVEREFDPAVSTSFMYTGAPAVSEAGRTRGVPETIYTAPDGSRVFELLSSIGDRLLSVFSGTGDVSAETDKLVSPDLERGAFIDCVEASKILSITVHGQTLNALNTGFGFQILREAVRRLKERYGRQLIWNTALELYEIIGNKTSL